MRIKTFDLERVQSLYENTVKYNLTESGFHPYSLNELLTEEQKEEYAALLKNRPERGRGRGQGQGRGRPEE